MRSETRIQIKTEQTRKTHAADERENPHRPQTKVAPREELAASIIELRRSKAELEAARNRYLDLYVNAPVPYVVFSLDGTLQQVNHAAVAALGVTARQLVGTSLAALLSLDSRETFGAHLAEVAAASHLVAAELVLARSGRVIQIASVRMADETNDVMATLFDVTDRKTSESVLQVLNRASVRLASVNSPAGVLDELPSLVVPTLADICIGELYDPSGKVHVRFASTPRYARALREVGNDFMKLPGVTAAVGRSVASGRVEKIEPAPTFDVSESRCVDAAADLDLTALLAIPLTGRGQVFGLLVLASGHEYPAHRTFDVAAATELARRASLAIDNGRMFTELHEEHAAKNRFLAMLAHELRTPLTPVLAAVTALLEQSAGGSDFDRTLRMIRDNVALEARLIDDLVDVVRAARGEFELKLDSVDAKETIQRVLEVCHTDLTRKRIALSVELRADRHRVRADPARLQQILWNLVRNAVKFAPDRGTVRIESHVSKGRLHIDVTDNGIGIDRKHLGKIFDPFAQADASIGPRFGGMGLGLAICKTLAQAHHGKIAVRSEGLGKGATFTLELPLESAEAELARAPQGARPSAVQVPPPAAVQLSPATPPSSLAPDGRRRRVLLVEDDADTREVTAALLRQIQYSVTKAGSFAEAVAAARKQSFDILISDLNLPDGTGLHLMRRLRLRKGSLAGIVLSGDASLADVGLAKGAGFSAYLRKPVTFAQLREALARLR